MPNRCPKCRSRELAIFTERTPGVWWLCCKCWHEFLLP